jgi:hypothetical protein
VRGTSGFSCRLSRQIHPGVVYGNGKSATPLAGLFRRCGDPGGSVSAGREVQRLQLKVNSSGAKGPFRRRMTGLAGKCTSPCRKVGLDQKKRDGNLTTAGCRSIPKPEFTAIRLSCYSGARFSPASPPRETNRPSRAQHSIHTDQEGPAMRCLKGSDCVPTKASRDSFRVADQPEVVCSNLFKRLVLCKICSISQELFGQQNAVLPFS